ncbi:MAG: hypothetical protein RL557_571 [archaeon]|jgi:hypothetical protein
MNRKIFKNFLSFLLIFMEKRYIREHNKIKDFEPFHLQNGRQQKSFIFEPFHLQNGRQQNLNRVTVY